MTISISRIKKWEQNQNISKLIEALQTDDDDLRQSICLVLGQSKSIHALDALRYIENNDNNEFVKITARKSIDYLLLSVDFQDQISAATQIGLNPVHVFQ